MNTRDYPERVRAVLMTLTLHKRLRAMMFACLSVCALLTTSQSSAHNPKFRVNLPVSVDEARDLEDIYRSGSLRVLYLQDATNATTVPRTEQNMLGGFASENGLSLEWIPAKNDWNLLSGLATGKADIVVGQSKSLRAGMYGQARFTLPWGAAYEQVVTRADTPQIDSLEQLAGKKVAIRAASPAWSVLQELDKKHPDMGIVEVDENTGTGEVLNRVADGQYDVAIISRNALEKYLPAYPGLTVAHSVSVNEPRVWAVPDQAPQLQFALNEFLNKNHLQFNLVDVYLDDLPKLKEKRILRMITYRNPLNYYVSNGRFYGFEYDLVRKFAKSQRMRLEVVLANSHEEMQQLLLQGAGDIIAASLPESVFDGNDTRFSVPYNHSAPILVGNARREPLVDVRDLRGKKILLPANSPYFALLENLQKNYRFKLKKADKGVDAAEILSRIASGKPELTVISHHMLNLDIPDDNKIRAFFPISEPLPHGWAVRKGNVQLLSAINQFIEKEYRGEFYNTLHAKYFESPLREEEFHNVFATVDSLSPFDAIVREYAEEYEFDWRLIVAQMFQESQFDPEAISYAGAEGLMQVLPSTARWMGAENLNDPASNIRAGIEYMNILRNQFENDLPLEERTWFTLAAYNAGFGRVVQARRLAEKNGLDPDRWFGNVENAMLALAKPYKKDGESVRICRCGQTVIYVNEIRALYNTYVRLTDNTQLASIDRRNRVPFDI